MSDTSDPRVEFGVDADDAQARQEANRLAQIFEEAFAQAAPGIGRSFAKGFQQAFKTSGVNDVFSGFSEGSDEAFRSTRRVSGGVTDLAEDLSQLEARVRASRAVLEQLGASPDLFAVVDNELQKVLRRAAVFNDNLEEIARDPSLLEGYKTSFLEARRVISSELDQQTRLLINFKEDQRAAQSQLLEQEKISGRLRVAELRRQQSQFVVEEQGANAQRLAETRIAGQRQVAQERATQRARLEILRFTLRQVRVFERAIASALRLTGRAAAGAASTTGAAINRITRLFRRSNRELNDGLNSALIQREQSMSRSFRRQTTIINSEITRQTATIERFERAASTGIVGAATGRSRLGGLLGGGLAIGGGFVLARQLREGFDETVNLNEAINRSNEIFGQASQTIRDFSDDSVRALFLTRSQAIAAASDFGIFGRSAGLVGEDLTRFSTDLTQLATDLASFNNTNVEDAVTALAAGLRGEQEPLRRYGVLLDQATLRLRALNEGIIETDRVLTPQERVLAAYSEILAQTAVQQGDAARTADDFANSSRRTGAALTELFAASTAALIPLAERISNGLLPVLETLTDFIRGDVSPALQLLRDGLIGVGIGLAALAGLRVAGESVRFLGIALRGLVTPLGLLLGVFAAAGAAITIFYRRSEDFAAVVRGLIIVVGDLARTGLTLAIGAFRALGELLTSTVLPAVVDVARIVGGALLTGLSAAARFVSGVVIPAFIRLADIVDQTILPAFRAIGGFITGQVVPALRSFGRAALDVLAVVVRFLGPAIDGFRDLGRAIADAFQTGDLSGLLGGLESVAVGIGRVFGNLGVLLYETLRPQVERAVGAIVDAFDRIDVAAIGLKVLEIVRLVGRVLGSIVSDPLFIQAVAAIGAAAVAVAANFVIGFAQGVRSNIGELGDLLGDALSLAFREAISFAFQNPEVIAAAILAAFAARQILNAWARAGQLGAGGLASGFVAGLRRSSVNASQFASGLFGGQAALREAFVRNGNSAAQALQTSFARSVRDLRRLGVGTQGLIPADGIITQASVTEANRRLESVENAVGRARVSGVLFGQRTSEVFSGLGRSAREFGRVFNRNVQFDSTRFRAGIADANVAFRDGIARMRAQGRLSGVAVGNAVLAGFGAVLAGQQGGAIGIAGIFTSAIAAGVTAGPWVGALVGAAGFLSKWWGDRKREAEEASAAVDGYADAVLRSGGVTQALQQISEAVDSVFRERDIDFQETFADFDIPGFVQEIADGANVVDAATTAIGRSLGLEGNALAQFALNLDLLTDASERLRAGNLTEAEALPLQRQLESARETIANLIGDTGASLDDVLDLRQELTGTGSQVAEGIQEGVLALGRLRVETGAATREAANLGGSLAGVTSRIEPLAASTRAMGGAFGDAVPPILSVIHGLERVEVTADDALGGLGRFVRSGLELITPTLDQLGDLTDFDFSRIFDIRGLIDYLKALGATNDEIAQGITETFGVNGQAIVEQFGDELEDLNDKFNAVEAGTSLVQQALQELGRQRSDRLRGEIDAIRDRLDDAREAADRARESLTAFITGRYADTPQALVDQLIGNIGSIGSEIEEALLQGGVRGDAALRSAVGGFESQLAGIIQAGFDSGLRTQDQFATLLSPLFAAIGEESNDSLARILSNVDFTEGITPAAGREIAAALDRALAGNDLEVAAQAVVAAEENVRRIEDQLNFQQAQMDVEVIFSYDQVAAALQAAGADQALLVALGITPESVAALQQSQLVQGVQAAQSSVTNNNTTIQRQEVNFIGYTADEAGRTAAVFIDGMNARIAGGGGGTLTYR